MNAPGGRSSRRFRYKATKARQAQERAQRKLERLKAERIVIPEEKKPIHFNFVQPPRTGDEVGALPRPGEGVRRQARSTTTSTSRMYRGDKVALVGPNGAGKSTLMKMIAGVHDARRRHHRLRRARGA